MTQAPATRTPTKPQHPQPALPDTRAAAAGTPSALGSYITLAKPRITVMVVVSVWVGFMFGAAGVWDWLTLSATLIGAALSCMGASVLNQVYERDTDALMNRTKNRPMPAGRVSVAAGWAYGLILSAVGVLMLALLTTPLGAAVSLATILSYALIYTPMKRTTHMATVVGAIPGALPPVLGYDSASGAIGIEAVLLFSIMFVWQLPHTLAIYCLYKEDYARAGFPVLPVIDPTGSQTFRQILIGSLLLLPLGLTPTLFGVSGLIYFVTAFACGLLMLGASLWLAAEPNRARARGLFFTTLIYLTAVLVVMMADRV